MSVHVGNFVLTETVSTWSLINLFLIQCPVNKVTAKPTKLNINWLIAWFVFPELLTYTDYWKGPVAQNTILLYYGTFRMSSSAAGIRICVHHVKLNIHGWAIKLVKTGCPID